MLLSLLLLNGQLFGKNNYCWKGCVFLFHVQEKLQMAQFMECDGHMKLCFLVFDSKGLRQPSRINQDPLTCNTDCEHLCRMTTVHQQFSHADVPPWLQHRDLKLFHDPSRHLLQTCLLHNSAPHTVNSRSFTVAVTFQLCHQRRTTLSVSSIVTRGFITILIEDGSMGTHRIRLLSSIPRVSPSARNSVSPSAAPADLVTPVFQSVSVENFTSTLFTSPSSLVRSR